MPHRQIWSQIWWTGRLQSPAYCHQKYGKQPTEFAGVVSCCTGMLGRGGHRFSRNRTGVRICVTNRCVSWCQKNAMILVALAQDTNHTRDIMPLRRLIRDFLQTSTCSHTQYESKLHRQIQLVWSLFLQQVPHAGTTSENSLLLHDLCRSSWITITDPQWMHFFYFVLMTWTRPFAL